MIYIRKAILTSLIIMLTIAGLSALYSETIQGELSSEVMRFHVLANSDSEEDQAMKLLVRDGLLEELSGILDGSETMEETRDILEMRLEDIEEWAETMLREQGSDYTVCASIDREFYPSRTYRDVSLPAGVYESLRVEIGAAEGRNWWCVMFPPLCFVDIACGQTSGDDHTQDGLENLLTAESFNVVTNNDTVKIKFKIVEIWQELKNKLGIS